VRASLVFCDTSGFKYLSGFIRTDTWAFDDSTKVTAYSAFRGDTYINLEISTQILLTDEIYAKDNPISREKLFSELSKSSLMTNNNTETTGLPYYIITPSGVNWNPATLPIIDPSCICCFISGHSIPFLREVNA